MLDITVCIMSYNRPKYLTELLNSVLSQTIQAKRVVIYDNGSDANVFDSISEFIKMGVEWVGADFNHSFIWNFNRAILKSDTKFTVMLHDDDKLCPEFLEEQVRILDADDNLVAISCNGYLISEAGFGNGKTLTPILEYSIPVIYTCSGQVALRYAGNSCIPFSPAIYRTEVVRAVKFREEYGKVCDAVFFCDLAELGGVCYQSKPLYECRIHSGQDSGFFPYELMNKLEEFFWFRSCSNEVERTKLHKLLLMQHASRNVKQCFNSIRKGHFASVIPFLMDKKFSIVNVFKVICFKGLKVIFRNGI